MTDTPKPPSRGDWWTRPNVVLPIVAAVIVIVALITPQATAGRFGDPRLSSHLATALGARVLSDVSVKLGWRVEKRNNPGSPAASNGRTIHAVLAPVTPVTPQEAHKYLQAVRGGDALLLALDRRTALSDSLRVSHYARGGILPRPLHESGECRATTELIPPLWVDDRVHLWGIRWLRGAPADLTVFARLETGEDSPPNPGNAAVGFPYGKGRIVIVGDPDLLRNDVLRTCRWGADVIAVRMLEWLKAGGDAPRTTLAFDEYHQGYGSRTSVFDLAADFLLGHPAGRMVALLIVGGFVLLLAAAPRALPPEYVERIERRDPLEQVDALAHAYEQVHATRTVTARLLHGVRWRVERSHASSWSRDDASFLTAVAERHKQRASDVALVRDALSRTIPDRELPEVGEALQRIEHTLTST